MLCKKSKKELIVFIICMVIEFVDMYIYMYIYIYIYIPVHVCFKEFWQKILRENLVEILVYKI